jgi:tetratricopeptide (TPR) repeat protein
MQPLQSARVLATCTWALERHWAFDAADTSTWSNSTTGTIEHVQAVGRHCLELLHQAAADAESGASSSSFAKSDPGAFGAEGSAASVEYHALLAALQLRVSALLTRGALCMSMALSRFDQANKALDAARAILDAQLPGELPPRREGYDERLSVRALTLSTAGKVARYCGQLVEAEALLHEALDIWRACGERAGAAATLHELGVVRLRRADWAAATTLLQQSLDMKRELRAALPAAGSHASAHVGALKRSAHTRQVEYSYEEAATLHQLAVASMAAPALAQTAPAAAPAAGAMSVETTPIGDLIKNEAAKAALEKALPEITQFYDQIATMTLAQVAPMSQGALDEAKLKEIQSEFDKIK